MSLTKTKNYEAVHELIHYFHYKCKQKGYQHWQSFVLFHSIYKISKFDGTVTRIVSSCTQEQEQKTSNWHSKHVEEGMSSRFHIHFVPDYKTWLKNSANHIQYPYFNKPFGLLHWMKYGKTMDYVPDDDSIVNEDDIVILLDPDMILLKSFVNDFSDALFSNGEDNNPEYPRRFKVDHGAPFATRYGIGSKWKDFNLTYIAGNDSDVHKITKNEADRYYQIGAPYLATARDMYNIAKKWTEFVPRVHDEHPHLLAEMFAYVIAAADLGLKHQVMKSFMISNPAIQEENWSFLHNISIDRSCAVGNDPELLEGNGINMIPNVFHFCQKYGLGEWLWSKGRLPSSFFTCDSPLLAEPPLDVAVKYNYFDPPKQKVIEFVPGSFLNFTSPTGQDRRKREAFALCSIIHHMNDASTFYKKKFCFNKGVTDKSMELKNVLFNSSTYDYRPEVFEKEH